VNRRQFLQVVASFGAGALSPATIAGSLAANQPPAEPIRRPITRTQDPAGSPAPPRIGIVAVGSAGCGVLSHLHGQLPHLAQSIAVDTSPFALYRTLADHYVWIGRTSDNATDPNTVRLQAKAAQGEIAEALQGLDLLFLVSGLGGAAGTGIAPVVADVARDQGILTIAAPITPFAFEGMRRNQVARAGLNALARRTQATVELANEALAANADDEPISVVLERATTTFAQLYRGIACVFSREGLVGVDQEDLRAALGRGRGGACFGHGSAAGTDCLMAAWQGALSHGLLGRERLRQARGVFVSIQAGPAQLTTQGLGSVMATMAAAAPDALTIYGAVPAPELGTRASVSLLAAL